MVYAGIVAGGSGLRMGRNIPKQFIEISGKPIIIHTVNCFLKQVDEVVIACHKDYIKYLKSALAEMSDKVKIIPGGEDRMASVDNILSYVLSAGADENDVILTHDSVRPFVSENMIKESIKAAREGYISTVAVPATDTVCIAGDGQFIDNIPDRKKVFNIQTPQTLTVGQLKKLMKNKKRAEFTDLCGLAINMGGKVKTIEGSEKNIKITSPFDLEFAELVIKGEKSL